jgi:hypothetical protein
MQELLGKTTWNCSMTFRFNDIRKKNRYKKKNRRLDSCTDEIGRVIVCSAVLRLQQALGNRV